MENVQGSMQRLPQLDANNVPATQLDHPGNVPANQEVKFLSMPNPSMVSNHEKWVEDMLA